MREAFWTPPSCGRRFTNHAFLWAELYKPRLLVGGTSQTPPPCQRNMIKSASLLAEIYKHRLLIGRTLEFPPSCERSLTNPFFLRAEHYKPHLLVCGVLLTPPSFGRYFTKPASLSVESYKLRLLLSGVLQTPPSCGRNFTNPASLWAEHYKSRLPFAENYKPSIGCVTITLSDKLNNKTCHSSKKVLHLSKMSLNFKFEFWNTSSWRLWGITQNLTFQLNARIVERVLSVAFKSKATGLMGSKMVRQIFQWNVVKSLPRVSPKNLLGLCLEAWKMVEPWKIKHVLMLL